MPLIRTSSTSVRDTEALRQVAVDLIEREQASVLARERVEVSCRSGCTACCRQAVPVVQSEVRALAVAIDRLAPDVREGVRRRIRDTSEQLRRRGFGTGAFAAARSSSDRDRLIVDYFGAGIACPLLDGDTCIVRDERPLACRDYFVTSDPVECDTMPNPAISRVRLGRDVAGRFHDIERHATGHDELVLALALDDELRHGRRPDPVPIGPLPVGEVVVALTVR